MKIDSSSLEQGILQLKKSIQYLKSDMSQKDHGLYEQFRASTIQAFEFTYELTLKLIRRQLDQMMTNTNELREMSFMDFIRTANEAGLVREVQAFKIYREKRNLTAHTYDGSKAEEVLSIVESFLKDAEFVLREIKSRNQ